LLKNPIFTIILALLIAGEIVFIRTNRDSEPEHYILREVMADYVYARIIQYARIHTEYPKSLDELPISSDSKRIIKEMGFIYELDPTFGFNIYIPGPDSKGRLWDVRGSRREEL
jgi:hypothetical protein